MQLIKEIEITPPSQTTSQPIAKVKRKLSPSAYLLLSFPLGIAYFIFVVVGVSLSAALTPIFIGIPLMFFVLTGLSGMMRFERSLAAAVLGEHEQPVSSDPYRYAGMNMFRRLGMYLINPRTYLGLLLFVLKLPLGIINFTVMVTLTCVSVALILTPAVYWAIDRTLGINIFEYNLLHELLNYSVTPLQESLMYSAIGIVLLLISVVVIRVLAELSARITLLAVENDI